MEPGTDADGDVDADEDSSHGSHCGDGECQVDETNESCPSDCPSTCGNALCEDGESAFGCPGDCPASCGDGACTHDEDRQNCSEDCSPIGEDGFASREMIADGSARRVDFYAPPGRDGNPALVIAFHGTGGFGDNPPSEWIDQSPDNDPSGLEGLADANRFVVAAPESRLWSEGECADWDNHDGWSGYYWETRCTGAASRGSDQDENEDLILVREVIAFAHETYNVNLSRVYLIGFSNGGFFSVHAAMILRDRIAAFAALGSGLVNCESTGSCTFPGGSGTRATGCEAIRSEAPSSCTSCDGAEKPTTIPTSGRLVPGFLAHNNNDDVVSVFYTCNLARRMSELGYVTQVLIGNEEGHGFPSGAVDGAWSFFSTRVLP